MKQKHHDYQLVPYPKLRRTMAVAERSLMKEGSCWPGKWSERPPGPWAFTTSTRHKQRISPRTNRSRKNR